MKPAHRRRDVERVAAFVLVACLLPARGGAEVISERGRHLAEVLDGMEVDRRWQPGAPVDWQTGEYDPASLPRKSHCSAFVAAVCARLDIFILRPPEHSEELLANAQAQWLEEKGPAWGWTRVADGVRAQHLANRGAIVVACYRNPDRDDAGHIAIVRPSTKSRRRIASEGPDVIQAGVVNYERASVKTAFQQHRQAWSQGKIRYYSHAIP